MLCYAMLCYAMLWQMEDQVRAQVEAALMPLSADLKDKKVKASKRIGAEHLVEVLA